MKRQILIGAGLARLLIVVLAAVKGLQIKRAIAEAAMRKMPPAAVTSY